MSLKEYPIVNDYIKKLKGIKRTKSLETKRRLRYESNQLLGIMTGKAAQIAMNEAKNLNL